LATAVTVLLAGGGCGRGDVAPTVTRGEVGDVVYERPPPTSVGTVRGLGPHLFEATWDRRGDRQGIHPSSEAVYRLVWSEIDEYQFTEVAEDARLRMEEIRLVDEVFRRTSADAPYQRSVGVPGDSLILTRTLRPWASALSSFGDQVAYERLQDSTVEGRPVRVYRISLAPPVAPGSDRPLSLEEAANRSGLALTPISLSGLAYIDIETGNRLLAEIEGRYVPRRVIGSTDPTDEVLITYRESRSPTQLPPTISAPPPDQVRINRRRPVVDPRPGR